MSALPHRIMNVLRDAGAPLSKMQLAERLELPLGHSRDARDAMAALDHELWSLASRNIVGMEYPNAYRPEFHFWHTAPALAARALFPAEARP
jgi:hypothetical protein